MTNRILTFITILLFQNFVGAQEPDVSDSIAVKKENIYKIFEITINQDNKYYQTIPWFTDNTNEKYFESDTIQFTHAKSYKRDYCNLIHWTFQKKNKMIRNFADYCKEPPVADITKENDYFDVRISEIESKIILELYNKKKLIERFKIESLVKNEFLSYDHVIQYILTLVRIE